MANVGFLFLDRDDVAEFTPPAAKLIELIEGGLAAHCRGEVVLPPKSHIHLDDRYNGHFNILPGYVGPIDAAGVKIIGDYVDNHRHGLPSEVALLLLCDPRTGVPNCLMDATSLTWLRTGAVTGVGAKHLARPNAAVVAHIGARGTALSNLKALAQLFDLAEFRIASKRRETREQLAARATAATGVAARPVDAIEDAVIGADIVVEATRLSAPEVLIEEAWLAPGALLVTYGWVMAVDPRLPKAADKLVVDDWQQCRQGGQLHPLIVRGELTAADVHAEIGQIVCGLRPGRERPDERILFWHRGFAISDIVLGNWIYERARLAGRGRWLKLWEGEAVE